MRGSIQTFSLILQEQQQQTLNLFDENPTEEKSVFLYYNAFSFAVMSKSSFCKINGTYLIALVINKHYNIIE